MISLSRLQLTGLSARGLTGVAITQLSVFSLKTCFALSGVNDQTYTGMYTSTYTYSSLFLSLSLRHSQKHICIYIFMSLSLSLSLRLFLPLFLTPSLFLYLPLQLSVRESYSVPQRADNYCFVLLPVEADISLSLSLSTIYQSIFPLPLSSRNQLSTLPAPVCNLPLKVLIACNNKLVSLPEELGQLRHLTELVGIRVTHIYITHLKVD